MTSRSWTAEQKAAILATDDVLLTANAGTGKTTTVVGKILWALGLEVAPGPGGPLPHPSKPIDISQVVAITFTEKAAHDLKKKLRTALEASSRAEELRWRMDEAYVGTIHGFCASLLREHALRLGIDPTFRVFDEREARAHQEDLIQEAVLEELAAGDPGAELLAQHYRLRGWEFTDGIVDLVRAMMRDLRWHGRRYEQWLQDGALDIQRLRTACPDWSDGLDDESVAVVAALYRLARIALQRWEAFQLDENVRDFDALVLDTRDLVCGGAGANALPEIRRRCRLLIIDELQDTDFAQRDIAFAIAGDGSERGPQLFFVGDPKQSIYRFRGADVSVWNAVQKALRGRGRHLPLTQSFRSTPSVVSFVNDVGGRAIGDTAKALSDEGLDSAIPYSPLSAVRPDGKVGQAAHLLVIGSSAAAKRSEEGRRIGAYIRQLVEHETVLDPESSENRPCRFSDVAVLYRASTDVELIAQALRGTGVPIRMAGSPHLERRLEILDLVNLLRLLHDPGDDLRALGFLRSPFVSLRDDVIARIRLLSKDGPLLRQAQRALKEGGWAVHPDPRVAPMERQALQRGLDMLGDATELLGRRRLDEIVDSILEKSGYRQHLVLRAGYEEALANIQGFLRMLEGYRGLELGQFLDMWDRWAGEDPGIAQGALHSPDDDVVTLSTIHSAKGLEWPVVILVKCDAARWRQPSGRLVTDPELGPLMIPKTDERGARATRIVDRIQLEEEAEEARLMYVALTRARDRIVVTKYEKIQARSYWEWVEPSIKNGLCRSADPPAVPAVEPREPSLAWFDRVTEAPAPPSVAPLDSPKPRWLSSATELMLREKDSEAWSRKYGHGVMASWEFTPRGGAEAVPTHVRGTLIHAVLERARTEDDLSELLDEAIGSLDDPDIENTIGSRSEYRDALEAEIERVLASPEWTDFTTAEHYRELTFMHLVDAREWRIGALDLYRPGDPDSLVVDFKTHPVESHEEADRVAGDYGVQVKVYREAAGVRGEAEVRLVFTRLVGREGGHRGDSESG